MLRPSDPRATQEITYRPAAPTTLEVGDGYELEDCSHCHATGRVAPEPGAALVICPVCQGCRKVAVPVRSSQRGDR